MEENAAYNFIKCKGENYLRDKYCTLVKQIRCETQSFIKGQLWARAVCYYMRSAGMSVYMYVYTDIQMKPMGPESKDWGWTVCFVDECLEEGRMRQQFEITQFYWRVWYVKWGNKCKKPNIIGCTSSAMNTGGYIENGEIVSLAWGVEWRTEEIISGSNKIITRSQ